jgi:hypothetical protein
MSKNKKDGPSCFGLFVKSWIISALAMGGIFAGVVALGIRYMGWSAQSWSDYSSWNSYPVLAIFGVSLSASLLAFVLAAFIGAASAFIGRAGKPTGGSSSKSKARPQSHRKTTV